MDTQAVCVKPHGLPLNVSSKHATDAALADQKEPGSRTLSWLWKEQKNNYERSRRFAWMRDMLVWLGEAATRLVITERSQGCSCHGRKVVLGIRCCSGFDVFTIRSSCQEMQPGSVFHISWFVMVISIATSMGLFQGFVGSDPAEQSPYLLQLYW
jgi:hypothetical protein